jgi:hypothetical protein
MLLCNRPVGISVDDFRQVKILFPALNLFELDFGLLVASLIKHVMPTLLKPVRSDSTMLIKVDAVFGIQAMKIYSPRLEVICESCVR